MNKTITKTIALIVPIFAYIGFIFDKNGLNLSIALTVFCYAVLFIADVYTPDQVTNAASAFCGKDHNRLYTKVLRADVASRNVCLWLLMVRVQVLRHTLYRDSDAR